MTENQALAIIFLSIIGIIGGIVAFIAGHQESSPMVAKIGLISLFSTILIDISYAMNTETLRWAVIFMIIGGVGYIVNKNLDKIPQS